jgi:hypothetical protein
MKNTPHADRVNPARHYADWYMAQDAFTIEGYDEQLKILKRLMTDDPTMRKRINDVIREVLKEARRRISEKAQSVVKNDPRKAYKAVRSAVYKRILGGQVNILQKRKAGAPGNYRKPLKGLPKRGGNRWGRSQRTKDLEGYEGMDRGFVLRFLNAGTDDREIRSYTDRTGTRHSLGTARSQDRRTHALTGNRGQIAPRNWFGGASHAALEEVSAKMQTLIDRIIANEFR